MSDYDVIVLGGGAPGEHCAAALAASEGNAWRSWSENSVGGESRTCRFRSTPMNAQMSNLSG